ncbi:50S ribosomal protein L2 [candidate division WWE3 bacterium RIFCSPHIGHO2_01_FULL_42_13]|uniref:50S ribosomal protein L2 n=1 Tax=candidate division WWE3 bacterium RIFCSPHIGHO2_01_FULL_42_13 TaxID=1802617 RepID=A0A1F4UQS6_UNCKA|nr:MAG: 50S ribosomal protein L2 [candidate division WWE3 bacterium RIFCSPHIGHO2_01_FULL_42_13]
MLKRYRPTSAGIRFRKTLVRENTTGNKSTPLKSLTFPLNGAAGRSNGRISSRHRQRGHKMHYRLVDFKRDKRDIPAKVASIEHDPNRGASIALLHYADGEKRYILAPQGLSVGAQVVSGEKSELKPGNALPMSKIPLGMEIHNVELSPGRGGQMARGAGNSAVIMAKEGIYVNLKLPSGEVKRVLDVCYATIGALGNLDLRNARAGKAGRKRHMGGRPHIRGVAHANPSDHPHGGSYKDNGIGMSSPKSPWGWKTRGKKTRSRNRTNKYLVKDRRIK